MEKINVKEFVRRFFYDNKVSDVIFEISKEELNHLIREYKKEVFDRFREIVEEHRKKSMITCQEDCFCWDIDTELLKEEQCHLSTFDKQKEHNEKII